MPRFRLPPSYPLIVPEEPLPEPPPLWPLMVLVVVLVFLALVVLCILED